jgi:hypothetical protein
METLIPSTVIVGEAVAGQAAADRARAMLESIIQNIDKQTLDAAELLYTIQSKGLYSPDYNTYKEYTRSIGLKDRKAEYLPKIVKVMAQVGIPRTKYGSLSISRLREITSLDPDKTWTNPETGEQTPLTLFIQGFVDKGEEIEMEDLKQHIRTLKGFVGENALTHVNFCVTVAALSNTIRPALEKMKALIGSVGKDDDGISKDASDGAALEAMSVEILNDPTLQGEE